MSSFKKWLYERFLPAWCREDLMDANRRLTEALLEQRQENAKLRAYIDGMQAAMRRQQRITINAAGLKEETA